MSEDLESRLRAALRPATPSEEFTQKLIARVTADQGSETHARGAGRRRPKASAWWLSASLAGSLLVAADVQHHLKDRRDSDTGLEARRQGIEPLGLTSQSLTPAT